MQRVTKDGRQAFHYDDYDDNESYTSGRSNRIPKRAHKDQIEEAPERRLIRSSEISRERSDYQERDTDARRKRNDNQEKKHNYTEDREQQPSYNFIMYALFGMAVMFFVFVVGSNLISFVTLKYNDFKYGNPKTVQVDQVVGNGDSLALPSHFIVMNYHKQITIIECPTSNCSKSLIYIGPTVSDENTVPAVTFKDLDGDGLPDMIIRTSSSNFFVLMNTKKGFDPKKAPPIGSELNV